MDHILVVRNGTSHGLAWLNTAGPFVGEVVGWLDAEVCLVLWGDQRFAEFPGDPRPEYKDELTTCPRPRHCTDCGVLLPAFLLNGKPDTFPRCSAHAF
jgi:hypothetical protein